MKRYFVVSYVYFNCDGTFGYGDACSETIESYLNSNAFRKNIIENDNNIKSVVLQNIIELNENDYNDYKR